MSEGNNGGNALLPPKTGITIKRTATLPSPETSCAYRDHPWLWALQKKTSLVHARTIFCQAKKLYYMLDFFTALQPWTKLNMLFYDFKYTWSCINISPRPNILVHGYWQILIYIIFFSTTRHILLRDFKQIWLYINFSPRQIPLLHDY